MNRSAMFMTVLLALAGMASAQEPPRPYSEAIDVEIVNVDVIVVDPQGAPVRGLSREDFTLFVDGKPVVITNFSAYHAESGGGSPPSRNAEVTDNATESQTAPAATWLVYVDLLRVGNMRRVVAIRAVQRFLEKAQRPGDRILVACYDGNALRILEPLTTDASAAVTALRRIESRLPSREYADLKLLPNPEAPSRGDLFDQEKERRIRAAIHALRDLATIAGGIEGRIGLVFIGGGYNLPEITDPHRSILLYSTYQRVLERLTEGRITAYTILSAQDLTGIGADLMAESEPLVDSDVPAGVPVEGASEIAAFAQETGGIAFSARPGLEGRLARVRQDFDSYYSLGFRPPSRNAGGAFDIDVRVQGLEAKVRHRASVRLRTDEEAAQDTTMAGLLLETPPANPWKLQLRVGESRRSSRTAHSVPVIVAVPLTNVLFTEERNGRHSAKLIFHFAVADAAGNFKQLGSRQFPLDIASADLERAPEQTIQYGVELLLAPGSNDLSVTVSDPAGRGRSSTRKTIVVGR